MTDKDKATYYAALLRDIAKSSKYDYCTLDNAADLIESQRKELEELRELCGELVEFARDINNECKSPYYSMNELYKWLEIRSEQELAKAKERMK